MYKAKSKLLWKVYIIQAVSGKLYTGITTHLERRLHQHLTQNKGARFFRLARPQQVVFYESYPNRSEASKRESLIKKMSRQEKLFLIDRFIHSNAVS